MLDKILRNFDKWAVKTSEQEMLFPLSLAYWRETLLEYCCKLFTWDGLPDTIPAHEIEMGLFISGYNSIVKLSNGKWISAVNSGLVGVTDYYDVFTDITFSTPLHYGNRKIGKNCVVVRNNTLMHSLLPKINRYAIMLAHAEISTVSELVNDRESNLFEVMSDIHAEGVKEYRRQLYNGELAICQNKAFSGVRVTPTANKSIGETTKAWDARNNILSAFFEEIGLKKNAQKRERLITDEVNASDEIRKLNLSDMLDTRQRGADELNRLTGWSVSVKCNVPTVDDVDEETGTATESEVENNVKTAE
jgi:hypothetical protein